MKEFHREVPPRKSHKSATLALTPALGLMAPGFVNPARADTYTAGCNEGTGDVADLISAIRNANANPGPDTVVLGTNCLYSLTAVDNWWYGPNGLPPIASEITLEGKGSTIQRDPTAQPDRLRFFYVGADPVNNPFTRKFTTPGAGTLTLRNLTLQNGRQLGGEGGGGGAGMAEPSLTKGSSSLTVSPSQATRPRAEKG